MYKDVCMRTFHMLPLGGSIVQQDALNLVPLKPIRPFNSCVASGK